MNELIVPDPDIGKERVEDLFNRIRTGIGLMTASTYFIGDACLELSRRGFGTQKIAFAIGQDSRFVNTAMLVSRRIPPAKRTVEMPIKVAACIARSSSEKNLGNMIDWWLGPGGRTNRMMEVQRKARELESMGIIRPRSYKAASQLRVRSKRRSASDTLFFSPPVRHACPLGSAGPTYTIKGRAAEPTFDLFVDGVWRFVGTEKECEAIAKEDFDVIIARAPGLAEISATQVYENYLEGCRGAAALALEKARLVASRKLSRLFSMIGAELDEGAVEWILEDPRAEWESCWPTAMTKEVIRES